MWTANGKYCEATPSATLVKYSTLESTYGKPRSSNLNDGEKLAHSEHDTAEDGMDMCEFTG
jgi:hypothetical protein